MYDQSIKPKRRFSDSEPVPEHCNVVQARNTLVGPELLASSAAQKMERELTQQYSSLWSKWQVADPDGVPVISLHKQSRPPPFAVSYHIMSCLPLLILPDVQLRSHRRRLVGQEVISHRPNVLPQASFQLLFQCSRLERD